MILMFQKEVAQRIKALPMTEDYGLLTVIAQTYWKISKLIDAGPREFFPPPNIVSRVLTFEQKTVSHQNRKAFLKLVKAAFSQRRKLMVSNLKSHLSPEQIKLVLQWLGENKKSEQIRAEELSPAEFEKLYLYLGIDSL
jgi:16S rRNA (adenine1518-N6/adenine1519-N6)-dimethyltransferase